MPTRNINLTDHLDRFIESEVGSGHYGSASEVVREGLRLMQRQKREERAKLKWLRGTVKEGLDQIDRGEVMEFRSIDELERHIDQLGKEASAELARKGRDQARSDLGVAGKPRHFLVYRRREDVIDVVRVLHDARDLERHLPEDYLRNLEMPDPAEN